MTQDEQQQIAAGMNYLERQIAAMAHAGANTAMLAEELAMKLKAAQEEIEKLKASDKVVPIREPA